MKTYQPPKAKELDTRLSQLCLKASPESDFTDYEWMELPTE